MVVSEWRWSGTSFAPCEQTHYEITECSNTSCEGNGTGIQI